jgi:hypothetical protein
MKLEIMVIEISSLRSQALLAFSHIWNLEKKMKEERELLRKRKGIHAEEER